MTTGYATEHGYSNYYNGYKQGLKQDGTHRNAVPGPVNLAKSVPGPKKAIIVAGTHVPRSTKTSFSVPPCRVSLAHKAAESVLRSRDEQRL